MQHLPNGMDQHCSSRLRATLPSAQLQNRITKERTRGTKSRENIYIYIYRSNVAQRNKRERLVLGRLKSGAHEERGDKAAN